jgi:hypothetical protein
LSACTDAGCEVEFEEGWDSCHGFRCHAYFHTEAACTSASECAWNPRARSMCMALGAPFVQTNMQSCESKTKRACSQDSSSTYTPPSSDCEWSVGDDGCVLKAQRDCASLSTQDQCNADAACTWTRIDCCDENGSWTYGCALLEMDMSSSFVCAGAQDQCTGERGCEWMEFGECSHQSDCESFDTEDACSAASCEWQPQFHCRPTDRSCNDHENESACTDDSACEWNADHDGHCDSICYKYGDDESVCTDAGCEVEADEAEPPCQDRRCSVHGIQPPTWDPDACTSISQCTWDPSAYSFCGVQGMASVYANSQACAVKTMQACVTTTTATTKSESADSDGASNSPAMTLGVGCVVVAAQSALAIF